MKNLIQPVTAEELFQMSHDGVRRELVRGEVKEMPPAGGEHGSTTGTLNAILWNFVREKKLGRVFAAETGFIIARNPDTVRAPDCAFVRAEGLPGPVPKKYLPFPPDLAAETVSPNDRPGEIDEKIADWLQSGVRLLWVLDPDQRMVTVYRSGSQPRTLKEGEFLEGEDVVPGFRVAVAELWS